MMPSGELSFTYRLARSCVSPALSRRTSSRSTASSPTSRTTRGCVRKSEAAAREGFTGKLAIHPGQVAIINAAFTPSPARNSLMRNRSLPRSRRSRRPAFCPSPAKWSTGPTWQQARTHYRTGPLEPEELKKCRRQPPDGAPTQPTSHCARCNSTDAISGPTTSPSRSLIAGICHSDLHICRNDWGNSTYPGDPRSRNRRHGDRGRR